MWLSLVFGEKAEASELLLFLASASLSSSLRAESASDLRIDRRASAQATDCRMSRGARGAPESPVAVAVEEKKE